MLESQTTVSGLPGEPVRVVQALFAAITVALISGAVADPDEVRFLDGVRRPVGSAGTNFPVQHWVFAFDGVVTKDSVGGWIANNPGAIDFAGGTAVHQRRRRPRPWRSFWASPLSWGSDRKPHNVPLTLLGAGMLWAGWYAFNGGSALAAGIRPRS